MKWAAIVAFVTAKGFLFVDKTHVTIAEQEKDQEGLLLAHLRRVNKEINNGNKN